MNMEHVSMLYSVDEVTQAPVIEEQRLMQILKQSYGIQSGILDQLTGYEDTNFRLSSIRWEGNGSGDDRPSDVIIKITNPIEARLKEHLDFQVTLCNALSSHGVPSPQLLERVDGKPWNTEEIVDGVSLPLRVFRLLPGSNLENHEFTEDLVTQIGKYMASLHQEADNMDATTLHVPFISPDNHGCIVREAELLGEKGLLSETRQKMVIDCLVDYEKEVVGKSETMDVGIIHSDFNETNLLVEERDGKAKITGVLDFGDCHISTRALDIAAAAVYLHLSDVRNQGIAFLTSCLLKGYRSIRPFNDQNVLLICIRARLACSLIYGLRTARINYRGGSVDYVLKTQKNGWKALETLIATKSLNEY